MRVDIAGKTVRLEQQQVIGVGGEGTVFQLHTRDQPQAVKIYHSPTQQREEKLLALLAHSWSLPIQRVAFPLTVVRDVTTGRVIGFTMPYLAGSLAEIGRLASKKQRISILQVLRIFLDGAESLLQLHHNDLVVGDMNDQNLLYRDETLLWVDADAWQFASYPCPVGSEDFLAPELYGYDLSQRPSFTLEHDWYAFAVHLFRSLLLVHPYGGTHPNMPLLTQRAAQHIFVLHPEVTYPKMARSPELLNDELGELFTRIFAQGWRGPLPLPILQEYAASLISCSSCQQFYPRQRVCCPHCQTRQQSRLPAPLGSTQTTILIESSGLIVGCKVLADSVHVLALEHGMVVHYQKQAGQETVRRELFAEIPGARYELFAQVVVVNPPQSGELHCFDITGTVPHLLGETTTAIFTGTRQAFFQTSGTHLYSILNATLLSSTPVGPELASRTIRSVMERHTWFTVAQEAIQGKAALCGYFQILRQQLYWLQHGTASYELTLPPLATDEVLLESAVYFAQQDLLIRRLTQERGCDYLHTEIWNYQGRMLFRTPRQRRSSHPAPTLHGLAYASGVLLHPTDRGILQENIRSQQTKLFSTTRQSVQEGATLLPFRAGLLIIGDSRVTYIVL